MTPTKLFFDLYLITFLDISVKLFFSNTLYLTISYRKEQFMPHWL